MEDGVSPGWEEVFLLAVDVNTPTAGHLGINKVLPKVKERFIDHRLSKMLKIGVEVAIPVLLANLLTSLGRPE